MLQRTAEKGLILHPDPDHLVALSLGYHDYRSLEHAERACDNGEISELELESIEDGLIEKEHGDN